MQDRINKVWLVLIIIGILNLIFFGLRILNYPDIIQVQYTPDDGYYYLTMARNFVNFGTWTSDSNTAASGYHLLFAYILALIYKLTGPNDSIYVKAGLGFTFVITMIALLPLVSFFRQKMWPVIAVASLIIMSGNFVFNSVSVMEWPLVLMFSSFYFYSIYRMNHGNERYYLNSVSLFLLGLGGSLARSDFGLLPFSMFLASLIFLVIGNGEKRKIIFPLFLGLFGAFIGLLMVFAHNFIFTKHIFQSSAVVKVFWSQALGHSAEPFLAVIFALIVPNPLTLFSRPKLLAFIFLALLFISLLIIKDKKLFTPERLKEFPANKLVLFLGSIIASVGYTIFYRMNSQAVQPWYTANIVLPVFTVLSVAFTSLCNNVSNKYKLAFSICLVIFVLFNFVAVNTVGPPWPHQSAMLKAGKLLRDSNLDGKVGAWNAGIIGFYQGGRVVNIDGLVNDEIYPYIKSNSLHRYLVKKRIEYIVDFEPLFTSQELKIRGGYNNKNIENAIGGTVFEIPVKSKYWRSLRLYKLDLDKLQ